MRTKCYLLLLMIGILLPARLRAVPQIPYQKEIDSLKREIDRKENNLEKAAPLFELSLYYSYSDSTQAHIYLEKALAYSAGNALWSAIGLTYQGLFFMDYDTEKALGLFRKADQALKSFSNPIAIKMRARSLANLASIYQWRDNIVMMMEVLMKEALPVALLTKDSVVIGSLNYKIGLGFWNNLQYVEASKYLNLATNQLEQGPYDPWILNECYKMLFVSEGYLKRLPQLDLLNRKYERFYRKHQQEIPLADYYYNKGVYYRYKKDFPASIKAYQQNINALKTQNPADSKALTATQYQLALLYCDQGDYKQALKTMITHDSLYKGNAYRFFQDSLNTASRYQIIYEKLGDYEQANAWGNKYRQLRDTLFNRKIKESMLDYNARYKALERESEIKILKADKEKSELAVRNTRLVVFLVAFILLLVIIMIFKNQQKNKRLLEQQEINNKQKLLEEQQKQQLRSMDAMLQGEEKERNRLSRDLHDGLGSVLASIKYKMLDLAHDQPNSKIKSVLGDMDGAIAEMRRISHNLMPEALRRFGFEVSLKDLCNSLQNSKTHIELQCYGEFQSLSKEQQTHLYRIIQELLYNALKHAGASQILVQCSLEDRVVLITVEDNGQGFRTALFDADTDAGAGLKNVQMRVDYFRGKMDIHSEIGKGTNIDIEVYV